LFVRLLACSIFSLLLFVFFFSFILLFLLVVFEQYFFLFIARKSSPVANWMETKNASQVLPNQRRRAQQLLFNTSGCYFTCPSVGCVFPLQQSLTAILAHHKAAHPDEPHSSHMDYYVDVQVTALYGSICINQVSDQ
jgi:hypothetical protein